MVTAKNILTVKNFTKTSGKSVGHSTMCRAIFTAAGEDGFSPDVMLLK